MPKLTASWLVGLLGAFCVLTAAQPLPGDYSADIPPIETSLSHPDGRDVVASVWIPKTPGRFPAIVFSHGAYSSPAKYQALLASWAEAGYIVFAALHLDSEVLTGGTPPQRAITWRTRVEDYALLLDQPPELVAALRSRNVQVDGEQVIAAGHSYGALIAQVFAGAKARAEPDKEPTTHLDSRVAGVIALSPPGPLVGMVDESGWDELSLPQLVVTGTADVLPGFIDDWQLHRWSHDRAKSSPKWLWVGDGVDHYFGNLIGRTERSAKPQEVGFDTAVSVSIDFLSAVLPSAGTPSCRSTTPPSTVASLEKN